MDKTGLLKAIFDSATDYAIITLNNSGHVTTWNTGAELITGYSQAEIIGKDSSIIFTPEDRAQGVPQQEFETARRTGRAADYRWHMRKDGTLFWADGVMTLIHDRTGAQIGALKILRDATERKRVEAEILQLTNFDKLTGLGNRSAFDARLTETVAASLRSDQLLILQLVDLDHFKQVNDSLGHHAGDILLQEAAQRMRSVTRKSDFVARIGGDEFAIIQPNAHSPQAGGSLADKLLDVLSQPYYIAGHEVFSGASIGIAVCPQDAKEPGQLLKKADLALYKVKNAGRSGFSYFTVHLDAEAHKRNRELTELRRAVEQGSFRLEYQPKVSSKSRRAIALEALLRCSNPMLARYPIEQVITLATDAGLMPKISEMVLSEACTQAKKWQDAGFPHMRICVNLCSRDLMNPGIPQTINAILDRANLWAGDLELEITERQLFDTEGQGNQILQDLRSCGVSIALDDFGTGYSSLSYLRYLPVNTLKLDQTFLRMIPQDPQSCAIARAIISLAHTLNIEVVAEGVESSEQADFFQRENCDAMQGFFFTRPLPPEDMTTWLLNQSQTSPAVN
jgi:diguanylate cyclase (GGDEF)-like protein/PAS domain S-box-containing protein